MTALDNFEEKFVIPRSVEAEQALLSLAFLGYDLTDVLDVVRTSDFYDTSHQQVWQAIINVHKNGNSVDVVTVSDEIKKNNLDPKAATEVMYSSFSTPTVGGGNAKRFATIVRDCSTLRQIIFSLNGALQEAQTVGADPKEVIVELEKKLIELSEEVIDEKPHDLQGILGEVEADIDNSLKYGWKGIGTGFSSLDEVTGGLIPTHVWIVGAYTGTGKTFFLLQVLLNVLKQGKSVMMISTEMDRKMNLVRMLGNLSGIRPLDIIRGNMDDYQLERLESAKLELKSFENRLVIYDNVYNTHEIRLKAKKAKLEHGLDVIVVDFIQNLQGAENIYERMSQAALDLQNIAQELKVTIIIASQVSQSSATWGGSKEVIEYKGAGEIAAIADVGLWIKKLSDKEQEQRGLFDKRTNDGGVITHRQLYLRKVRHGEPAKITLRMDFPAGTVEQVQDDGYNKPQTSSGVLGDLETIGGDDDFEPAT